MRGLGRLDLRWHLRSRRGLGNLCRRLSLLFLFSLLSGWSRLCSWLRILFRHLERLCGLRGLGLVLSNSGGGGFGCFGLHFVLRFRS